jgi:hypothetical protein
VTKGKFPNYKALSFCGSSAIKGMKGGGRGKDRKEEDRGQGQRMENEKRERGKANS